MLFVRSFRFIGLAVAIASATPALAQSCKERFIKAASEGNGEGEYRQIVTQTVGGAPGETIHEFAMNGPNHWLVTPIKPDGTGWTLLHEGVMYSSLDNGGSWREIAKFDKKAADNAKAQQKGDVKAAINLECETEQIEGKMLDRVHGQYEVTVGFKSTQVHTYWIDPESKLIVRSRYETISPSFKSTVTQRMIPFGDAVVPVP